MLPDLAFARLLQPGLPAMTAADPANRAAVGVEADFAGLLGQAGDLMAATQAAGLPPVPGGKPLPQLPVVPELPESPVVPVCSEEGSTPLLPLPETDGPSISVTIDGFDTPAIPVSGEAILLDAPAIASPESAPARSDIAPVVDPRPHADRPAPRSGPIVVPSDQIPVVPAREPPALREPIAPPMRATPVPIATPVFPQAGSDGVSRNGVVAADDVPADRSASAEPARTPQARMRDVSALPAVASALRTAMPEAVSPAGAMASVPAVTAMAIDATVLPMQDGAMQSGFPAGGHATSSPSDAVERPRDFGALLDRLVQAREAAGSATPASVRVALPHAEFGGITMRFDHSGGNLAIGVASADPAFAPTIRAALADAAIADQTQRGGQSGTEQHSSQQHGRAMHEHGGDGSRSGNSHRGPQGADAALRSNPAPDAEAGNADAGHDTDRLSTAQTTMGATTLAERSSRRGLYL